jgi:hypothetical protein
VSSKFVGAGADKGNPRQLLTCRELDGRTSAAKAFDRLAAIASYLGGSDRLSASQGIRYLCPEK